MSEVSTEPAGDLVETVAKSIATAFGSPWDWFSPQGQEAARTEARAAIAVMPDRATVSYQERVEYEMRILEAEAVAIQMGTELAVSRADVARLREAIERARKAPMIDHRDAANSVYGILEAAIKDTQP